MEILDAPITFGHLILFWALSIVYQVGLVAVWTIFKKLKEIE